MLEKLKEIAENLHSLLLNAVDEGTVKTMYIEYGKPCVSRLWFPYKDMRIFLHKIEQTYSEVFIHPHKWDSAMLIIDGSYEMGIGHSETNEDPMHKLDSTLILPTGTMYEMMDKDAWHYVKPIGGDCYTLMISGKLNGREMPKYPPKEYRTLTYEEIFDLLTVTTHFDMQKIETITNKIIDK